MSPQLDGHTKLVGVMGDPVSHSLSPRIHNHWCARYGVNAVYVPLPVPTARFEEAFRALPALGFVGVNLTIPFKTRVLPLLDGVEEVATRVGAVNTVMFREDKAIGTNTDSEGFADSLRHAGLWQRWEHVVVLGAGGAAQAIVDAIAPQCGRVTVCNRSLEKAKALVGVTPHEWNDRLSLLPSCDLLINTTSLGMTGQSALDLPLATLKKSASVVDIVYSPAQTPLLEEAKARGHATVNGLGMLLYQAVGGFERWFGVRPEVDETLWRIAG